MFDTCVPVSKEDYLRATVGHMPYGLGLLGRSPQVPGGQRRMLVHEQFQSWQLRVFRCTRQLRRLVVQAKLARSRAIRSW